MILSRLYLLFLTVQSIIPDTIIPRFEKTVSELHSQLEARDQSMSPITHLRPQYPLIRSTDPTRQTRIMAILNLTPDSFSDGGLHDPSDPAALAETINNLVSQGASIIDIGGQSTRPGATEVSSAEELARILPAIKLIRENPALDSTVISVDTFLPSVAKQAIEAGADIINDISGGQLSDNKLLKVVADARKSIVLMHMRGDPSTMNSKAHYPSGVVEEVGKELKDRVNAASAAGIPRWRIILDPGIGFAKNGQQNLTLLRDLTRLRATPALEGYSWLLGTSRKAFIGRITDAKQPRERVMGTAATVTASIAGGADIVRVHDVEEMRQVAAMSDAIYRNPS
jgi:2-amino-4-hydroxy-6-hydroxymethyldihydropteridine diphosphokinase / dihydropteroate synthase